MMLWREHWSCIGDKRWKKSIINTLLGNGWSQYICTVIIVIVGASIFAITMQQIFNCISNKLVSK